MFSTSMEPGAVCNHVDVMTGVGTCSDLPMYEFPIGGFSRYYAGPQ